ncbi:MAG: universal stress protein [Candidatus Hodarchaeota archaeon]
MMKKILVAFDGSKHAQKTLDFAIDLAEKCSASITVLSVSQHTTTPIGMITTPVPGEILETYSKSLMDSTAKVLADAVEKAREKTDVPISPKLMEGRAADTIIQVAEEEKSDLIVIGSRGLSGIKRFFLGSVSNEVVNQAKCPVLVVK